MNKIGIYYGYWTPNWVVDFSQYAKKAKEMGFDIIEFDLAAVLASSNDNQEKLKSKIEELEIEMRFCIGLDQENDISSADTKKQAQAIKFLEKAVKKTNLFGATTLSGIIYGAWGAGLPSGITDKTPYLKRSAAGLDEVLITADQLNISCNIEVVNRFEQCLINTHQEALKYLGYVKNNNLKIHLDSFHMNIEEDSFYEAIINTGDKLGHFHIGSNNRQLPGTGHLPWEEIFRAIKKINYQGALVMEPFVLNGGDIVQDIKLWRDLNPDNKDQKLLEAKNFIVNHLK